MSQIIDRRQNTKKSAVNRQRFLRRFKNQIKEALSDAMQKRSITDINRGEKITLPTRDLSEPQFEKGAGGEREIVIPGNKEFRVGDKIQKPLNKEQAGSGENASNDGEGVDEFLFELSREEFLNIYFDDLELPLLIRKALGPMQESKSVHAGISRVGTPTNIHVVRTMKQAITRRLALRGILQAQLNEAREQLKTLSDPEEIKALEEKIAQLEKRRKIIPFIDTVDVRYSNKVRMPMPSTQAVMFCIMDVSGSMDEAKKDIAKRFFTLLYLFLTKNYNKIELVFIRHHTSAKEVDEETFFYSRETGGTVVSSALELSLEIIEKRYPPQAWNIYIAQASDGDNWNADSPYCQSLLQSKIIPLVQYYAYVEIMPRHHQSLWQAYEEIKHQHKNFAMQQIEDLNQIYPVFRELFKRKHK